MELEKDTCIRVLFCISKTTRLTRGSGKAMLLNKKLLLLHLECGLSAAFYVKKEDIQMSMNDIHSLSHSKWNCKYHIVFAPKYRRKIFYGRYKAEIGKILRKLCEWKGVNIIEAEMCPDHVHMLVEIPPKYSVSKFVGYLKGKSSTMLYEQFGELKYKYRNREFWCKGYYVDTVGKNETRIAEYIKHQLDEDQLGEQLTMGEVGPFKKNK